MRSVGRGWHLCKVHRVGDAIRYNDQYMAYLICIYSQAPGRTTHVCKRLCNCRSTTYNGLESGLFATNHLLPLHDAPAHALTSIAQSRTSSLRIPPPGTRAA